MPSSLRRVRAWARLLLARLLTDFHLQERRPVAAFDLNAGEGTLAQFLPEHVTRSAIDDLKGQMALFDRLMVEDGATKIVDVGRASFETFFVLANQFGFAEGAHNRGIVPTLLLCVPKIRFCNIGDEGHREL